MINEVIIRCQKTPEVGIRRIPAYIPPIHPWNQSKIGGPGQDFWGPVPPWPQPKTATAQKTVFLSTGQSPYRLV